MRRETTMLVGYARTSTSDQLAGLEAQIAALTAAECERIYREHASAVGDRPEFTKAMEQLRAGDTLIVTKLDRLARSVIHLLQIVEELKKRQVELKVLEMGLDTNTATGRLMLGVIGAVGQFEREMMRERQLDGIADAKAQGKYKGGKRRIRPDEIRELRAQGLGASEIARKVGIGRASVYRVLASQQSS
jgi:DNA invertase Pin-like site-specific DNA recombinase